MRIILTNLVLHFASLFCAGHCYEFEVLATSGLVLRSATTLLSELLGCRLTLGLSRYVHYSVLADVVAGRPRENLLAQVVLSRLRKCFSSQECVQNICTQSLQQK